MYGEYVGLVQIVDRAEAILLDWRRPYKPFRMTEEGLLRGGRLVMDKAVQVILRNEDPRQTFLGVEAGRVVELVKDYMPPLAWVERRVAEIKAQAQRTGEEQLF